MRIEIHPHFRKSYKKRVSHNSKLINQTQQRIQLFKQDSRNPVLNDHGLTGSKRHLRAFSVTGNWRILYYPVGDDTVVLFDIGTHNQVY